MAVEITRPGRVIRAQPALPSNRGRRALILSLIGARLGLDRRSRHRAAGGRRRPLVLAAATRRGGELPHDILLRADPRAQPAMFARSAAVVAEFGIVFLDDPVSAGGAWYRPGACHPGQGRRARRHRRGRATTRHEDGNGGLGRRHARWAARQVRNAGSWSATGRRCSPPSWWCRPVRSGRHGRFSGFGRDEPYIQVNA